MIKTVMGLSAACGSHISRHLLPDRNDFPFSNIM